MKKIYLFICLSLAVLYAKEPKHILLLNSYHQGMTWVDNLTQGTFNLLETDKNNLIIHIENMDSKRHNTTQYYNSLAQLYKSKYKNINIELILSSDNNAFDFLKRHRNTIFGQNIPVVFSGVNDFHPSLLNGYKNYTGVAEKFSDLQTIDLMLKLHPKAKEIYIINDYLKTGRAWEKTMRENLKNYENKIKITYAKNQTIKELQQTILNLPKETLVLMGVYFADKENNYITYEQIGKQLLDISKVPVYCLLNFNISDGVIGGNVISGYQQGAMMAKLALNILQGINIAEIDVVTEGANQFIFNKKALNKFNIEINKLPKNSLIINDQATIYEQYGFIISVVLIIFSLLLALVIFIYYKKDITNEKGVLKLLVYGPITFIPTIIAILIYSILSSNEKIHKENLKNIIESSKIAQKNIVKNEVEKLSNTIYKFKQNKDELFEYINTTQYSKNGYLFALDKKGVVLAHGSDQNLVGKNMYLVTDKNNIRFAKKIIHNALINSLEFVEYQWENPTTKEHSSKYVYSKFLPEYDIVIASGIYDDDINSIIHTKTEQLNKKNNHQINQILWIALIILLIFTSLAIILSNLIKKIFEKYNKEIDDKNDHLKELNSTLEEKIEQEVIKSQQKDSLIFQQSKMVSMGEMIGNIAHQWRQPLSVISTSATGMKVQKLYNLLDENSIIKSCEIINENAQYLSKTIDDFRNYIKNDREKQLFDLKSNIDNLLSLLAGSLKNHNITLSVDIEKDINIDGYPNELIQCMMNIMNNAKDALKDIDNERYIFITAKKLKNNIIITFKDNANGIEKGILDKIFDPYFTTKHKSQGTGLGLSMTYNMITEGMSGSIEVENVSYIYNDKEYNGALFIVKLPLQ